MIKSEIDGLDTCIILKVLVSTTDDTTIFIFKGSVDGNDGKFYIVNKYDDTGIHSVYTQTSSSTDSLRGIRIRNTVTFNGVGNASPFYLTIYGLSEAELPTDTCVSGVHYLLFPVSAMVALRIV